MLTTIDLALSNLHFLLATPHRVATKSDSLPQGPTSRAPKLAQEISKYLPLPVSGDCAQ